MAYASRSGRARTHASSPEAFGVCQRCGFWFNRVNLHNQYAWRGAALLPIWVFVCDRCMDVPNEQERAFVLPADPVPIQLPLPEDFDAASTTVMGLAVPTGAVDPITGLPQSPSIPMATTGLTTLPAETFVGMAEVDHATPMGTTDGAQMVLVPPLSWAAPQQTGAVLMGPTPTGRPPGYALEAVMPLAQTDGVPVHYGVPLPVSSIIADGTPLIRVSCRAPHGLALNQQIAVQGSENPLADGMFSVIPVTATVFAYGCYSPVEAGSILGPETTIVTAQVGLPRSHAALPQDGLPQTQVKKGVQ
jgi:hypothetical protein